MVNNKLQKIVDEQLKDMDLNPDCSDIFGDFENMLSGKTGDYSEGSDEDFIENKVYIKDIREAIKNSKSMPLILEEFQKLIIKNCATTLLEYINVVRSDVIDEREYAEQDRKRSMLVASAANKLKAVKLSREEKEAIGLRI